MNLKYFLSLSATVLLISCGSPKEEKSNTQEVAQEVTPEYSVFFGKYEYRPTNVMIQADDPAYAGNPAQMAPILSTKVRFNMNSDGSISGTNRRVQYRWQSGQTVPSDSAIFEIPLNGVWEKRTLLKPGGTKETVYEVRPSSGYIWYVAPEQKLVWADDKDNYEEFIHNQYPRGYKLYEFNEL